MLHLPQMISKVHKLIKFSMFISTVAFAEHSASIFRHKMELCSLNASKKSSMMCKWKAGVSSFLLECHVAPNCCKLNDM